MTYGNWLQNAIRLEGPMYCAIRRLQERHGQEATLRAFAFGSLRDKPRRRPEDRVIPVMVTWLDELPAAYVSTNGMALKQTGDAR